MRRTCAKGATVEELFLFAGLGAWTARLQLFIEPDSGESPIALNGAWSDADDGANLLHGETAEVSELDDFGLAGILLLEPGERFIEQRDLVETLGRDGELVLQLDAFHLSAALIGVAGAGVVDEDAAHDVGGEADEMGAVVPVDVLLDQAEVGFIDQGGRLQGVVGALAAHAGVRDAMQLCVDERQELLGRCSIAGMHGFEEPRGLSSIVVHEKTWGWAGVEQNAAILVLWRARRVLNCDGSC